MILTRISRGLNAQGRVVETVVEYDPDEIAARKAAREAAIPKIVPGLDFLRRLTLDEYGVIVVAAQSDAQLSLYLDMLRVNGEIDVNGNTAKIAKAALVKAGLLTAERAGAIFAAP